MLLGADANTGSGNRYRIIRLFFLFCSSSSPVTTAHWCWQPKTTTYLWFSICLVCHTHNRHLCSYPTDLSRDELHCPVDATNNNGDTALMFASAAGHKDICELLLNHNAKLEKTNNFGQSALHVAVCYSCYSDTLASLTCLFRDRLTLSCS